MPDRLPPQMLRSKTIPAVNEGIYQGHLETA